MKRAVLAVALFAAGHALAASFDCAKASTRVERLICADKDVSALDDRLASTYRLAKAAYPAVV
jgi:uncharacterized protein